MDEFSKCPRCGEIDERRTRCACGYAADGVQAAPPAPAPRRGESPPPVQPAPSEGGSGARLRLAGLVLFASGVLLAYISVYEPLLAAGRQQAKIFLSLKGSIFCPLAVVMGAVSILFGSILAASTLQQGGLF